MFESLSLSCEILALVGETALSLSIMTLGWLKERLDGESALGDIGSFLLDIFNDIIYL